MNEDFSAQIVIRMSKQLRKSIEKLAAEDRRNLSDYVRLQLEKIVETEKEKRKIVIK